MSLTPAAEVTGPAAAPPEDAGALRAHIVPPRVLLAVFGALLAGTALTYAATWVDLGPGNLWLAMAIAAGKAACVALWFMHLRYDRPFLGVIFLTALLFLMLFVGIALMDSQAYHPDLIPDYAPGITPQG